jgi:hypothetical protein
MGGENMWVGRLGVLLLFVCWLCGADEAVGLWEGRIAVRLPLNSELH